MSYKSQISKSEIIKLGDYELSPKQVISEFSSYLTEERLERLCAIARKRSYHVATIVEHLYDKGNISAVMRSAEAFSFIDFNVIERPDAKFKESNRISKGTEKWLNLKKFDSTASCVESLKSRGYKIVATHLDQNAKPIVDIDYSQPVALVFGNEKEGVTPEMVELCDETMIIPMNGFAQSFNISVAAAISFYHSHSKRSAEWTVSEEESEKIFAHYILRTVENPKRLLEELKSRGRV